ncbi:hypothetical protein FQR65_LT00046 [Abscondita terminalis]|nr:hypothetical protein FQR65_LT00046 [Abscondita terminalis]
MEIKDTRNFALEKLTTMFNYPCKYQIFGCKFILHHEQFKLHHSECLFAFDRCPMRTLGLCNDVVPETNLSLHLLDKHSSHVWKANAQISIRMGVKGVHYFATTFENAIFLIFCDTSEQFKINFITVLNRGMDNSESKYKYELEFVDQTGNGLKLIVVLPVYCSSRAGNICGRCIDASNSLIKNGDAQRAVAYEAVAQFLLFPCSNNERGCEVKLEWDKIAQHEEECQFNLCPCPFNLKFEGFSPKCDWAGSRGNLVDHLHSNHNNFLQADLPNVALDVSITNHQVHKSYKQILLHRRENNYFLTLHKSETEQFTNVQEIVNKQENMIVADVSGLRALIDDPNGLIFYKICILKNPINKVNQVVPVSNTSQIESGTSFEDSEDEELNLKSAYSDTLLDEIECPICNEYMTPPIFICPTGHSICNSCRPKIRICPSCRSEIQNSRNFALEKLTTVLEYRCKYWGFGCNLRLNYRKVELHQQHCSYAFEECPFKSLGWCNDRDVDLIEHFRINHGGQLMKTNCNYLLNTDIKTGFYAVITPDKELFILCFEGTEQFKINFIHVINRGINKTKSPYKYKLQFCDKTGDNLEFAISQLCQIIHPFDRSLALKKCLSIPQEMIEPFVTKNPVRKVTFKFDIEEI